MNWEPRPLPEVNPETAPFWAGAAEGEFLLRSCSDCGLVFYYPRHLCPDCFGDAEWVRAEGIGEVYSYSVTESLEEWPEAALPLVVAYVELTEGPRVMTNVHADPADVSVGTPVEVTFIETDREDVAIPVFVPVDS